MFCGNIFISGHHTDDKIFPLQMAMCEFGLGHRKPYFHRIEFLTYQLKIPFENANTYELKEVMS